MNYSSQSNELIQQLYHCYYQSNVALSNVETKKFKIHFHEYYEILILTHGNIDVIIQDTAYHLGANELIIIPPNTYHYIIPDKTAYQRIILHFSLNEEKKFDLEKKQYHPHLSLEFAKTLAAFIERFISYYENFSLKDFNMLAKGLTTELILLLCNAEMQSSVNTPEKNPLIKQLIDYIDEHIHEQITLKELSQHFFLSANYISIIFKKEMHIPIITYIKEKKLTLINIAFKNGEKSLAQLTDDYGFSTYSNLFKLYKKTFGHPPSKNKNGKNE